MSLRILKRTTDTRGVYQRGIQFEELGIQVRRFQVRYFPEVDERIKDKTGQTIIRTQSMYMSREVTCEGEVARTTNDTDRPHLGVLGFTFATALAFANNMSRFHDINPDPPHNPTGPFGSMIMDDATEMQDRGGWRSVTIKASSNPGLQGV